MTGFFFDARSDAKPRGGGLTSLLDVGVPHSRFRDVTESGAPLIRTDVVALETLRRGLRADAFSVFGSGV